MIIADLRRFHDLGARQHAADLLLVLRFFLTDYPDARLQSRANLASPEEQRTAVSPRTPSLAGRMSGSSVKTQY
jgi:hypothetical protein